MMPRLRIDPTTRYYCSTHGNAPATYVGRERYECWHCATEQGVTPAPDAYRAYEPEPTGLSALVEVVEPVDLGHPADCDCPFCYN